MLASIIGQRPWHVGMLAFEHLLILTTAGETPSVFGGIKKGSIILIYAYKN